MQTENDSGGAKLYQSENIVVVYMNLPYSVNGFTLYNAAEGFYTIVLNSRLSYQEQIKTYEHELRHIKNGDFYSGKSVETIENRRK